MLMEAFRVLRFWNTTNHMESKLEKRVGYNNLRERTHPKASFGIKILKI
jgi:hypothetical protein